MKCMSVYTLGLVSTLAYASVAAAQDSTHAPAPQPAAAPAASSAAPTTDASLSASTETKPLAFGVFGGGTLPVSNLKNVSNNGWNAGAALQVKPEMLPFALRLEGRYDHLGSKNFATPFTFSSQPSFTTGALNIVWSLPASGEFTPYLIGGVGVYHLSYSQTCSGTCTGFTEATSTTRAGVNAGAGVSMALSGFSTFVEARWHDVFTQGNAVQMVPISVGVMFHP